jgi:DNA end-binding protein Ku
MWSVRTAGSSTFTSANSAARSATSRAVAIADARDVTPTRTQTRSAVMAARAIWKGELALAKHKVAVKFYSAVEDRTIHFHLLHSKDQAPVEQHIVRKDTGEDVAKEDMRKAYAVDRRTAIILQPDELAELEPPESREIELCRFVAPSLLGDQWYDRPYYLGPDGGNAEYFALAEALERQEVLGIARWVMRRKRYIGALSAHDGYLVMTTLRRADQVLSFSGVEPGKAVAPRANELKLAEQLVESITADFDPAAWQNEYRERLCKLIQAKARGKKIAPVRVKKKPSQADLAASLRASIAAARKEKRVA